MRDANCALCPLHQQATIRCIWGRISRPAPSHAPLVSSMVVGEAPGQQEDKQGRVFIGPSGALLDEALDAAGITDAYLTNTAKCYPGYKQRPKPAHTKACAPYLDEEIASIKPKAILALGETAWHRLGGVGGITDNEGKEIWSDKYGCWILPARSHHFIYRSMGHKSSWLQVIHRFRQLLDNSLLKQPPVQVTLIQDSKQLAKLSDILVQAPSVVYDFETNRLPWWHKDFKALTVAFTVSPGKAFVLPLDHPQTPFTDPRHRWQDFFVVIRERMQLPEQKHTAHQGVFDDLVWFRLAGYRPYLTLDTMALAHALDENRPRGLKWLGRALLGWPDWGIDTRDLANDPLEQVAFYNGCDTAATWLLRDRLLADLKQDFRLQGYVAGVLMPGLRAVEGIIERGIFVDRAQLDRQTELLTKERDAAAVEIPVENPNSTKQVAAWLYETLGLAIPKKTDGGAPSTDEETIHRLALTSPDVRKLLDYRKPQKMLTSYLAPIAAALPDSIDGRLHYDVKLGPKTGRFASRFHTTPRDADIRSVFSAPEGSVLLSCDYRQIEARLVAWAAAGKPATFDHGESTYVQGWNFLAAFMTPERDVYREMAARVLGRNLDDVTNQERQIMGKVPTLAMLYKISADGLRDYAWREYQIEWTAAQTRKIHDTFYVLWPEVRDWQEREALVVSTRGWNQSVLARKIRLPDAMSGNHEAIGTGINMPIQSLASDITLTAARLFQERAVHHRSGHLVGFVHDALLIEVPVGDAPGAAQMLQECMLTAPAWLRRFGLDLPDGLIQVELTAGPWGSKTTLDQWQAQRTDIITLATASKLVTTAWARDNLYPGS